MSSSDLASRGRRILFGLALAGTSVVLTGCQTAKSVGYAIVGIEAPAPAAPAPAPAVAAAPAPAPARAPVPPPAAAPTPPVAPAPAAAAAAVVAAPTPSPVPSAARAEAAAIAGLAAADPTPQVEPLHPSANRLYAMHGRTYVPITDDRPFRDSGAASVIEARLQGRETASGELYDAKALTAAHPRLPIPSWARITNPRNSQVVIVRINDRGPVRRDRAIDLSRAAAERIGLPGGGEVEIVRLTNAEVETIAAARKPAVAVAQVAVTAVPMPPATAAAAPTVAAPATATLAPPPVPTPPVPSPVAAPPPVPTPPRGATMPAPVAVPTPPAAPVAAATAPVRAAPAAAVAAGAAGAAAAATRPSAPRPAAPAAAPTKAAERFTVQVGVFAVRGNAETVARRANEQLALNALDLPQPDRTTRVEQRGERFFVVVGDKTDRAEADALAERMRRALRQDVVVLRR
jgi:rare lipoprotein A